MSEEMVTLTFGEIVERLWLLNDLLRPRLPEIEDLPYDPAFERVLDDAIGAFFAGKNEKIWDELPAMAWRVLLERQTQAIILGELHKNEVFASVPPSVVRKGLELHLALFALREMKLPLPIRGKSRP